MKEHLASLQEKDRDELAKIVSRSGTSGYCGSKGLRKTKAELLKIAFLHVISEKEKAANVYGFVQKYQRAPDNSNETEHLLARALQEGLQFRHKNELRNAFSIFIRVIRRREIILATSTESLT